MLNSPSITPVIFTDLDGSLLDHYTYSFAAATPLLDELNSQEIPVIPITSKTYAEVIRLRRFMGNSHPFITENGAALFIPKGYFNKKPKGFSVNGDFWVLRNTQSRDYWLAFLYEKAADFSGEFETFSSVVEKDGLEGLAQLTGLSTQQAEQSHCREHSEPIIWTGSKRRRSAFIDCLSDSGAKLLQGGRFLSLGGQTDKGSALLELQSLYAANHPSKTIRSLAIGDSDNDINMLEVADSALVIKSNNHQPPALSREANTLISKHIGPQGWAEGVASWLQSYSY